MNRSIGDKVSEVIKRESSKLSAEEKESQKMVLDLDRVLGGQPSGYTIAPRDTIGKNVLYNTTRR